MKQTLIAALLLLLSACTGNIWQAQQIPKAVKQTYTPSSERGPYKVEVIEGIWSQQRGAAERHVPWLAYLPDASARMAPIVVWSHGLGGSREGNKSIGRHLASHGYAAFQIQHAGTDISALDKYGLRGLIDRVRTQPSLVRDRLLDIPFVVDEIQYMSSGPLQGRVDPNRMGMSGHSFGAMVSMVVAGQSVSVSGIDGQFPETEFRAAQVMSPPPPRTSFAGSAFDNMALPLFYLSGSQDKSPVRDLDPSARRIAFDTINSVDQFFLEFTGGNHFTYTDTDEFAGISYAYEGIERHRAIQRAASLAFWDAYLREDTAALDWLKNNGLQAFAADAATFVYKPAIGTDASTVP